MTPAALVIWHVTSKPFRFRVVNSTDFINAFNHSIISSIEFEPTQVRCETSQALLAGVPGGISKWGELSFQRGVGGVILGRHLFGASCPDSGGFSQASPVFTPLSD